MADGDWRQDSQAKDWAGKLVAEVLNLDLELKADQQRVKIILKTWLGNGVLKIERRRDEKGNDRPFIVVGKPA